MLDTSLSFLDQLQQQDDSHQWNHLVELYTPVLRSWLRRYDDLSPADVDDLVQEALLAVTQELPQFRHNQRQGAFRAWLRRILIHRLRNFWRERNKQPRGVGGSDFQKHLEELEDDASGISQQWDREHDLHVMRYLLNLVRPRFADHTWQAFSKQVLDNQSPEIVADELQLAVGSVYIAKSRVLQALRNVADGLVVL